MQRDYDWSGARADYIASKKGLRQIAREYGIPQKRVFARSKAEGWPAARAEWIAGAADRALERCQAEEVDRLEGIIRSAMAMSGVIEGVFVDEQQFRRHLVTETDVDSRISTTVEKVYAKYDTKAIRDMTSAIKDMTSVLRNLLYLPTQSEREAQRIAGARLELEQRKAALAEKGTEDRTIRVEIVGDAEEYAE